MITQEQIKEIIKRIVDSCKPIKIILFGSYAHGTPTKGSDLDLLVVVESSDLPRYKRAREIRKHLWGITDIPKDILVYTQEEIDEWKEVEEAFITNVIKTGEILYEKEKDHNYEINWTCSADSIPKHAKCSGSRHCGC